MNRPAAKASGGVAIGEERRDGHQPGRSPSRPTAAKAMRDRRQGEGGDERERCRRQRDGEAGRRAPRAIAGSNASRMPRPLQATESERRHDQRDGRGEHDGVEDDAGRRVAVRPLDASGRRRRSPAGALSRGEASATISAMTPICTMATRAARPKSTSKRSAS